MEEYDHTDKSQWLPQSMIMPPERAAKLGMDINYDDRGFIKSVSSQKNTNILNYLHNQEILNDKDIESGNTYQQWRSLFQAFSTGRMVANYSANKGSKQGFGNREQHYCLVIKSLSKPHHSYVNYAIDEKSSPTIDALVKRNARCFQEAFYGLTQTIERIKSII